MNVDRMLRGAASGLACGMLVALVAAPAGAQGSRGKAELKTEAGAITVDYGRPSLKGRDMLSRLEEGSYWRMGMNEATVLTTPVDLVFGTTKVPKGSYSLWLKKVGTTYQLVFNSQTGQWGTQHDPAKDVHNVVLKEKPLDSPIETFTIDMKEKPGGGDLDMTWGAMELSGAFMVGK